MCTKFTYTLKKAVAKIHENKNKKILNILNLLYFFNINNFFFEIIYFFNIIVTTDNIYYHKIFEKKIKP